MRLTLKKNISKYIKSMYKDRVPIYLVKDGILYCPSKFNKPFKSIYSELFIYLNTIKVVGFLITIFFGDCFNQNVDNLPYGIKTIYFGYSFNQNVDNLPQSIKKLSFGCSFNQSVDKLPQFLEEMTLNKNFNQSLNKLPKKLNKILLDNIPLCFFTQNFSIQPLALSILTLYFEKNSLLLLKQFKINPKNDNVSFSSKYVKQIIASEKEGLGFYKYKKIPYGTIVG